METTPKTLTQAIRYYSDEQTCIDAVAELRWPDGKPVCPKCGVAEGQRKHYWLASVKRWKCYSCRKQFSVKVGTPFEDSPLSLEVFLIALWMLCNCRNGVSSYEIGRATGIAQKSAWFVLQRLRLVLKETRPVVMGGEGKVVVTDETFVGGKVTNMHHRRLQEQKKQVRSLRVQQYNNVWGNKIAVQGFFDKTTREIRATVVPNVKRRTLQKEILANIVWGSTVHSDTASVHFNLKERFVHETVNHAFQYVRGEVTTNSLENFWSLLKRTLNGTYVAVEPFHLDRYLAEQCFRFNTSKTMNDSGRFRKALTQVGGKRLTWAELTGKGTPKAA